MLLLGAGIGLTVLRGGTGNMLEIVLSFGLAALLFFVTEELLTERMRKPRRRSRWPSLWAFYYSCCLEW